MTDDEAPGAIADRLARLPRVRLAELPTPLTGCPRLTRSLAGPRIMVKRDDCTGLAFAGNKVRQHEYVIGDAVAEGPRLPGAGAIGSLLCKRLR